MPTPSSPRYDREEWARELNEELPALIASTQRALDATPVHDKENRERLIWRIRRAEKRMTDLRKRLAEEQQPPT